MIMAEILIVEDDAHIALTIQATLSMAGYGCHILHDGRGVTAEVASGKYDLVLLDVMLPGEDGFSLMEKLRGCGTPVIFLTAKQDVLDKVAGLRLGAEDYIVKPFEALELLVRIEVVLRRYHKLSGILTYGDLRADTEKHEVTQNGVAVALTPKEFDVLVFLMQHVDVAVTREQLLRNIWGINFIGETRTVDMHIRQLRKKLKLSDALVTIPKLGYRLEKR